MTGFPRINQVTRREADAETPADEAATAASAAIQAAPTRGRSVMAWARRHLVLLVIGTLFTAMVTYLAVERLSSAADTARLSARNPAPDGAMALARVLERHGVNVRITDKFTESINLLDSADHDATVLLYDQNGYLDEEQLQLLAARAGRLVVVAPRSRTLAALSKEIRQAGVLPDSIDVVEPGCTSPDPQVAGPVTGAGSLIYTGPEVCYADRGAGAYAASSDGRLIVLGNTKILGNGLLEREGNAALAIRTLGNNPELIWFLPGISEVRPGRDVPTLNDLQPSWTPFVGFWLLVTAGAAVLWRGRRHGPLVAEPLPVVVKAAETAEGRARLYQEARAVQRAADNLRAGSLTRLARHFKLGSEAGVDAVVQAVQRELAGRSTVHPQEPPNPEVRRILREFIPRTDSELVQWAQQLERLEKEAMTG